MKDLFKFLPWALLIGLGVWIYSNRDRLIDEEVSISNDIILHEIENLGRLELVRYNFKEITELKKNSKEYLKFFKLGPDSKIALISVGEAVGCVDLAKIEPDDIRLENDTLYINMPEAELCYYKLDLNKTRIYSLQTNPLIDEKAFIKKAYDNAEAEIKKAALRSGILKQTQINSEQFLRPFLEEIADRPVVFTNKPHDLRINEDRF